jgi:hypothetical protein
MLARIVLSWSLLSGIVVLAQVAVPARNPQISGTFPRGDQRRTELEVTIQGRNLQGAIAVSFRTAKVSAATNLDPLSVQVNVRIAPDVEPGCHDVRLIAKHGSAISCVSWGESAEREEVEPNSDVNNHRDHWPNCSYLDISDGTPSPSWGS